MSRFETAQKRFDIYLGFIELGVGLLKEGGLLGFIIPYPFLSQNYAEKLRKSLLRTCTVEQIVDLSDLKVFQDAMVRNVILIVRRESNKSTRLHHRVEIVKLKEEEEREPAVSYVTQQIFHTLPNAMFRLDVTDEALGILKKIDNLSVKVGEIAIVAYGARGIPIREFQLDAPINDRCKKMIKGRNIGRYQLEYSGKWFLYEQKRLYRPAYPELFENEKLVASDVTGDRGVIATYDGDFYYADHTVNCCILKHCLQHKSSSFLGQRKISISPDQIEMSKKYNLKYVLGLINSRLDHFYFQKLLGTQLHVYPKSIEQLPIRRIDFDNPEEKKMHDDLVALVDRMLELNRRLRDAVGREREELKRKIERTDWEIDELVYRLYGVTPNEIEIIERC